MIYQTLRAPNDKNGNPQRLTMVYCGWSCDVLEVRDHGYQGDRTPEGARALPTINITPNEYRCLKALYSNVLT